MDSVKCQDITVIGESTTTPPLALGRVRARVLKTKQGGEESHRKKQCRGVGGSQQI
jgi:hypothetical protein